MLNRYSSSIIYLSIANNTIADKHSSPRDYAKLQMHPDPPYFLNFPFPFAIFLAVLAGKPPRTLEKKSKRPPKARKIAKGKKQGNPKKQGKGGSGQSWASKMNHHYRSSQNYYRQSSYSWEFISPNYRYRYRLEIRMNSFNYHYRYRLGVRSHPFHIHRFPITILKVIWIKFPGLQLPLPSWNVFELER